MKMKSIFILIFVIAFAFSCGKKSSLEKYERNEYRSN